MIKLNKPEKEIVSSVVKGKGVFKSPWIKLSDSQTDKRANFLDSMVKLYLAGLIRYDIEHDIEISGPHKEPNYKRYVLTIDKHISLKDLKKILKEGKYSGQQNITKDKRVS